MDADSHARDPTGQGLSAEVDELRRTVRELRDHVEQLGQLYRHSPVGLCLLDTDLRFLRINEHLAKINGLPVEEHLGKRLRDVLPQLADILEPLYHQVIETGQPVVDYEVSAPSSVTGGEPGMFLINYHAVRDRDGEVAGVGTVVQEITARKKAEQRLQQAHEALHHAHLDLEHQVEIRTSELRQSEERWRSITENCPDVIMLLDSNGCIQYINYTVPNMTLDQVIGRPVYEFVDSRFHATMRSCYDSVLASGEPSGYEVEYINEDDESSWYNVRVGPLKRDGRISGLTVYAREVTQHKAAEQRLVAEEELLRRLLELQEADRKMIAYEIHDGLVQDMVGAKMHLDAIIARSPNERLDEVSLFFSKAIDEARRLISDLRPMIIDERGVLEAIKHLIAEDESQFGLVIQFDSPDQLPTIDSRLEGALFRIVQEALNNVKRHSQVQRASVRVELENEELRVEIEDRGVGFDPTTVTSDKFGLRGIRERARLFNGRARIRSSPGDGTIVRVEIPLK